VITGCRKQYPLKNKKIQTRRMLWRRWTSKGWIGPLAIFFSSLNLSRVFVFQSVKNENVSALCIFVARMLRRRLPMDFFDFELAPKQCYTS